MGVATTVPRGLMTFKIIYDPCIPDFSKFDPLTATGMA
jgi:hypothetical protein